MSNFHNIAKSINNAEQLSVAYLRHHYKNKDISFPINPFQMLLDENVKFAIRDFGRLEGVYVPAGNNEDIPIAGININRPISRQRFTAAHELCHHLRDFDKEQLCPISSSKSSAEYFADKFAAGILMPLGELRAQVDKRKQNGYVEFDDVLEIADYFGVSFESCLFRIAYFLHAIPGNTEAKELKNKIKKYKPELRRKDRGFNNLTLYEGLIDSYSHALTLIPNEFVKNVFQNNYIYNDSRMEGVDLEIETVSEIVTNIRLNAQSSPYCSEGNEAFLSIAGHSLMYSDIFETPISDDCSVFEAISLNRKLFSCYPHPEFGGQLRKSNTIVSGAKFEPIDYKDIYNHLLKVDEEVIELYDNKDRLSISQFIEMNIQLHHKLTTIHPFADGNGRTLRAFFNVLMVKNKLTPIYIKVEDKDDYLSALSAADTSADYAPLYEFYFKNILRSNIELTR